MTMNLFWKSLMFWVVALFALVFATALMPGLENWPEAVPFVVILAIALGQLWYIKQKQRADPEAYKVSPRSRRNFIIAAIPASALFAVASYRMPGDRTWHNGIALIWASVALLYAYRLIKELRAPTTKDHNR